MTEVADAIRSVTAKMQEAIEAGQRFRQIDADDLIEVLLAIADCLDPPGPQVAEHAGCPKCGQRNPVHLVWQDDETVRCESCGAYYRPGA